MPEVADLALVDEIAQGSECLVDVRARIRAMYLKEVDPVGVQPPQRVLDATDDPTAGRPAPARIVAHRQADFGREHDVVALARGQRLADDLLRLSGRVDVGGVDEVDPGVERGVGEDPDDVGAPAADDTAALPTLTSGRPRASRSRLPGQAWRGGCVPRLALGFDERR